MQADISGKKKISQSGLCERNAGIRDAFDAPAKGLVSILMVP